MLLFHFQKKTSKSMYTSMEMLFFRTALPTLSCLRKIFDSAYQWNYQCWLLLTVHHHDVLFWFTVPQQKSQCSSQLLTCRRLEIFCGTKLYGQALRHLLQKFRLFSVAKVHLQCPHAVFHYSQCLKPSKLSDKMRHLYSHSFPCFNLQCQRVVLARKSLE